MKSAERSAVDAARVGVTDVTTEIRLIAVGLQSRGAACAEGARVILLDLIHGAYPDPCERLEVEADVASLQRESFWEYFEARLLLMPLSGE